MWTGQWAGNPLLSFVYLRLPTALHIARIKAVAGWRNSVRFVVERTTYWNLTCNLNKNENIKLHLVFRFRRSPRGCFRDRILLDLDIGRLLLIQGISIFCNRFFFRLIGQHDTCQHTDWPSGLSVRLVGAASSTWTGLARILDAYNFGLRAIDLVVLYVL